MMPVRMAETAVTPITASPGVPMMARAAWNVGTESTPRSPFSAGMYSCQEANPSGTEATLTSAMAA